MPQRMLHLLHVVTAFMAKWLTGHGRLSFYAALGSWLLGLGSGVWRLGSWVPAPHPESNPDRESSSTPCPVSCVLFLFLLRVTYKQFACFKNACSSGGSSLRKKELAVRLEVCQEQEEVAAYLCAYLKINVNSFIYFLCQIKRFKGYIAWQYSQYEDPTYLIWGLCGLAV